MQLCQVDACNNFSRVVWPLLQSSLLVSPHLRSLEPQALAPPTGRPGHSLGELYYTVCFVEAHSRSDPPWHSASMHRFSWHRVVVHHDLGNAAQFRHGNVGARDSSRHESIAEAQDATDKTADSRR